MARYEPASYQRQVVPDPSTSALLFIDVQNFNCHPEGALYKPYAPHVQQAPHLQYWWHTMEAMKQRWQTLAAGARAAKVEVLWTVIQSLTADGRDRGLDYKISGFHVPPGCWDAQVLSPLQPASDEMVLPKSTSSVFTSTTLDYILRNLGVRYLLIAGCVTDQCVTHAVKDAADLGYLVTLVTDCCATYTQERHDAALSAVGGYCRQVTLQQLMAEWGTLTTAASLRQP